MELTVQVNFERETEFGRYADALYFSPMEIAAMTQEELDVLVDERVNSWVDKMRNPVVLPEPTEEQREAYRQTLLAEKEKLESMLNGNQV